MKDGLAEIAETNGWDLNIATDRGYAFQRWVANVITGYDQGVDTAPEDALLFSQDLGAAIVLEDAIRKHLIIAQCKYVSLSKNPPLKETEVNDFFSRHGVYMRREWIEDHGSAEAKDALRDYAEKIESGYTVDYYFVSTGEASERMKSLADGKTDAFASQGLGVRCVLLDFAALKDFYGRSLTLEESIPEEVTIDFPDGRFIHKTEPFETITAIIKGNALRNLYRAYKESLFNWNIRGYLGDRSINQDISHTVREHPGEFFYYNNGVSAICTALELQGNRLIARNFQIINGAQTVGTLGRASPEDDVEVLFRVTRTKSVKTDKGINANIIRFNNTQNAIKVSDFRANDPIQYWLQRSFANQKAKGALPKITYQAKRGGRRGPAGTRRLRMEDLAKIRYSYLYEPTLVHSARKELWTPKTDGGKYHLAFGVRGDLLDVWSAEEFGQTLAAVALAFRIEDTIRSESKGAPESKFLTRLRFHIVALAGLYVRGKLEWRELESSLATGTQFESLWSEFWTEARRTMIDAWLTAEEQNVVMFAFVRGSDRWSQIKRRFALHTNLRPPEGEEV